MPSIPRTAFARGTRAACACVAKLPNCSWLAPHLNAFRLRFVFSKDVPGCAHLAHLAVIARGVFDIQLRCVHGLAALKAGFHFRIENPGHQQRAFDWIWRAPFSEVGLYRMRQCFEEISVVPWTNIETRRARLLFAVELTG